MHRMQLTQTQFKQLKKKRKRGKTTKEVIIDIEKVRKKRV